MKEKVIIKSKMVSKIKNLFVYISYICLAIAFLFLTIALIYEDYLIFYILHWAFLFITGVVLLFLWGYSKCELIVTDKNIVGKTLFGKEVVLPIHMISAYSTQSWISAVMITTASGLTRFCLIENYNVIGEVLRILINSRQETTQITAKKERFENKNEDFDSLKKLKELLDSSVITQEEFDVKKKEILGL